MASYDRSALNALLDAVLQGWSPLFVCGPEAREFLPELVSRMGNCHVVALLGSGELDFSAGSALVSQVVADHPLPDLLRSCLRQDPDCLLLDERWTEAPALMVQAVLTGHRVVCCSPRRASDTADQLRQLLQAIEQPELFNHLPPATVLFEPASGQAAQLLDGKLRTLLRNGVEVAALELPAPPEPAPPQPLSLPPEWSPRVPLMPGLLDKLSPFRRIAWAPLLQRGDDPGLASKFGGRPALKVGEAWPACGACGSSLQLVAQIALADSPTFLGEQGWFQFFYCADERCSATHPWEAWQPNSLARLLDSADVVLPEANLAAGAGYPVALISGWHELSEIPASEERAQLVPLDDAEDTAVDQAEGWVEHALEYSAYLKYYGLEENEVAAAAAQLKTHGGDKLMGWPVWSQAADYPNCPICQTRMQMLLQINNGGIEGGEPGEQSFFGQLFAGDGIGHVFRCVAHPEQMTFSWACG